MIESDSEIIVVGAHTAFDDVPNSNEIADAEVAVVDISRDDRLEMISDLLGKKPGLRVVVIVDGNDLDSQAIALKLGAVGIVMKERSPRMLFEAIRQTHKGETWLNQVLLGKILERNRPKTRSSGRRKPQIGVDSLTARELEVVELIAEGIRNKEVGDRLKISEATVRHHLSSIYGKIGVDDKLNLIVMVYERGWIKLTKENGHRNGNGNVSGESAPFRR